MRLKQSVQMYRRLIVTNQIYFKTSKNFQILSHPCLDLSISFCCFQQFEFEGFRINLHCDGVDDMGCAR